MYKFTKVGMGLILIETESFPDERGFFTELYRKSEFKKGGVEDNLVQENLSYSHKGVLRGLHYQRNPMAQGKLINVLKGNIFDVTVDIRKGSPTFGKWYCVELSAANNKMLWIPEGFAHGFFALEDSHVFYKTNREYSKEHEGGILWNDPDIGIVWPVKDPKVNKRDGAFAKLKDAQAGFTYV
jgi:dTDP-4-dehydrorhamnose 3,5-epimerase